jgi:hypothetical protein
MGTALVGNHSRSNSGFRAAMEIYEESQPLVPRYALILLSSLLLFTTHTTSKVAAVLPPTRSSDKAVLGTEEEELV